MLSSELSIIPSSLGILDISADKGDSGIGGSVSSSEFSIISLEILEFLAWKNKRNKEFGVIKCLRHFTDRILLFLCFSNTRTSWQVRSCCRESRRYVVGNWEN